MRELGLITQVLKIIHEVMLRFGVGLDLQCKVVWGLRLIGRNCISCIPEHALTAYLTSFHFTHMLIDVDVDVSIILLVTDVK